MGWSPLFLLSLSYSAFLLAATLTSRERVNHIQAMASPATNETQLIEKVCSETLEPNECFQCINADPTRDFDDTPELIHSLLFCMYSEATHAHVTADLLSQNATIPSLKGTLARCSSLLLDAANLAMKGMMSMEGNKYSKGWDYAKIARRSMFKCANVFRGNADFTIPSSVLEPLVRAKRLYDATHVLFRLIVP